MKCEEVICEEILGK